MKKVLAIAPYTYLPFFSGGQKLIAKFFEYLGLETRLTVIGTQDNDWSLVKNYTGLSLLKKSFSRYYDISLANKISGLINKEKHEILICEHPYLAWLAFRIRKKTGIKIIIHTHNIEHQRFRSLGKWWWPVLQRYEKQALQKADGLFFITPEDKQFAITKWGVQDDKCLDVPFGIDINKYPENRKASRELIQSRHGIEPDEMILSFNGALDYKPNLEALTIILENINPRLLQQHNFRYKILISGKGLPAYMKELKSFERENIIYTGFTDSISTYLEATDIFLNPVLSGGGIKTKIVEAIGFGATVISTSEGAAGMNTQICGSKLKIITGNDWEAFVDTILSLKGQREETSPAYYHYFYWGAIAARVAAALEYKW